MVCEDFESTLEQEQKEQVARRRRKERTRISAGKMGGRERETEEGLIRLLLRPKSPLPIGLVLPEATTFPQL